MLRFRSKHNKDFANWCKSAPPHEPPCENFSLSGEWEKNKHSHDVLNALVQGLNEQLHSGSRYNIVFNDSTSPSENTNTDHAYVIQGSGQNALAQINSLNVAELPNQQHPLAFRDAAIRRAEISGNRAGTRGVVFENCDIAHLTLKQGARVTVKNTRIGTLQIHQANLIDMEGGCVLNIEVSAPGATNPLTGSIDFVNTFFPKNRKDYLLPGPQPYRNMRHHLRAIENGQMANLFHSAELAVERERDTGMNRFLSHAYELFSDFGSSAARPIAWWFFIGMISSLILFFTDGAGRAFEDNAVYSQSR